MNLETKIQSLEAENASLKEENTSLKATLVLVEQQVKALEEKVLFLLKQIEQKSVKKDSHNSHNPPSQDKGKPKRNQSLRKKSGKKPGGQPGHKGHTLKLKAQADEIRELKVEHCGFCGEDLSNEKQEIISKRQVIEIPPIKPIYIEYRQHSCACTCCGYEQKATYPQQVKAPIQYGTSVIALISYFNVFQCIPYLRLKGLFTDVFTLPISEGSIENLLNKAANKAQPVYNAILDEIKTAKYAGSDETGAKVNGKKWWVWVWQNMKNTFLIASASRGFDTVEAIFPDGLPHATIGSDRWAAQLKIESKDKQLCYPHLTRDLVYLEELEKHDWATQFKNLLKKAINLKHISLQRNRAYHHGEIEAQQLENQLNSLLTCTIVKKLYPKTLTFQKSMIKHRNHLFPCLYDLDIPPDNNASERAVRNVKVKQKISGQFKSGQDTFCTLRSVIDTLRKRKLNVLEYLKQIMALNIPE